MSGKELYSRQRFICWFSWVKIGFELSRSIGYWNHMLEMDWWAIRTWKANASQFEFVSEKVRWTKRGATCQQQLYDISRLLIVVVDEEDFPKKTKSSSPFVYLDSQLVCEESERVPLIEKIEKWRNEVFRRKKKFIMKEGKLVLCLKIEKRKTRGEWMNASRSDLWRDFHPLSNCLMLSMMLLEVMKRFSY